MGVFAKAQPDYAARRIATFPMGADKAPAVTGFQRIGLNASGELAAKFPDAPGLGFMAGRRSGLTVLDVDTDDERVLADALAVHGETPVIVRSGSGNFHAWYRNNGEPRQTRQYPGGKPIDVLGGGVVIAPPSLAKKGAYSFIQGGLDDLEALPVMRGLEPREAGAATVCEGERNDTLFRHLMQQAPACDDLDALLDVANTFAGDRFTVSLSPAEIERTAASAWSYEQRGENWIARKRRLTEAGGMTALAIEHPDALALLIILRDMHPAGRTFALARSMCAEMQWDVRRWRKARDRLRADGLIICQHEGGRGPNDPPLYRLA